MKKILLLSIGLMTATAQASDICDRLLEVSPEVRQTYFNGANPYEDTFRDILRKNVDPINKILEDSKQNRHEIGKMNQYFDFNLIAFDRMLRGLVKEGTTQEQLRAESLYWLSEFMMRLAKVTPQKAFTYPEI